MRTTRATSVLAAESIELQRSTDSLLRQLVDIEEKRLAVDKERLEVDKQRLAVEQQRLHLKLVLSGVVGIPLVDHQPARQAD